MIRRLQSRQRRQRQPERGAALVEMALVTPLLLLLLFGIIEFAWVFSSNLDVRHGAREGARLAAVNYPTGPVSSSPPPRTDADRTALITAMCSSMDIASGVTVELVSTGPVGATATATASAPVDTLTGFLDWAIPSGTILTSSVEIRVEQPATWTNTPAGGLPCP